MNQLQNLLQDVIKYEIGNEKDVAIFFSGGTDSLTCLFTCLDLGLKPTLYTFHLENYVSEDVIISKKIAEFFNLKLEIISIKKDEKQLIIDIKDIIKKFNIDNKIRLQILYPFPHMLSKISESIILTGLSADTLYGTNYHSKMNDTNDFNEIRRESIDTDKIDGYNALKKMVHESNKKLVAPYRDKKIIEYFLKFSWNELNSPLQKNLSYNAFIKYFDMLKIYRKSSSLPVNSKIIEWHNTILSSELNKNNRDNLDEVIQDILYDKI